MIYLDSSAIVKLVVSEPETEALHALLVDDETPPVFTSGLALTEVKRALHARDLTELAGTIGTTANRLDVPGQAILARPVTAETLGAAGDLLPGSSLRSLDAVHLATARAAGDVLSAVVTYDHRMAAAAAVLSLAVLAPGSR